MEELDLIKKYTEQGDFESFEKLYLMYFNKVYAYIFRYIGNKEIVEDLVSETFETLMLNLKNFNSQSKFSTFLIGIAKNKVMQHIQSKYRKPGINIDYWEDLLDDNPDEEYTKTNALDESEILLDKIKIGLEKLDGNYKEVIRLRFFENLDTIQTAQRLNVSKGNVRILQNRAIKKLQNLLLQKA